MSPDVTDLTPQQQQAIDLYMSGKNTGDIAEMLGVHRRTLWRWRQLPAFSAVLREEQQLRHAQIRERVAEVMRLALASIERALKDVENPNRYNPIDTALHTIRLLQSASVLSEPALRPEALPTLALPEPAPASAHAP